MMGNTGKVAGLIVAAGYSSRMGKFKPLLPLGGATVLENTILSLQSAGLTDILVVLGHRADVLQPVVERLGAKAIINPAFHEGMYSSIEAGVRDLSQQSAGFLLLPGDNPLIRPHTIAQLLEKFWQREAGIIYPCFQGQRGHPPLIASAYLPGILNWQGSGGLKAFLEQYEAEATEVEVIDQGILLDLDNPLDYQAVQEYYEFRTIPTAQECLAILQKLQAPERVCSHGQKVAEIACSLADQLNRCRCPQNIGLVRAAGLLHDLAKGQPKHAEAGAKMLQALGFPQVAEIVASHTDIRLGDSRSISAKELVYLADKLVIGSHEVTLQERFQVPLAKFHNQPAILHDIKTRLDNAQTIKRWIEEILA